MNKKYYLVIALLLCSVFSFAQGQIEIRGRVKTHKLKEITLYSIEDGVSKKYATTTIAPDSTFGFLLSVITPAFYTLGNEQLQSPIYVESGQAVNIVMDDLGAHLVGKNSKKNKVLYLWEEYCRPIKRKIATASSTYKDFFPELELFVASFDSQLKSIKSGNREFDELLRAKMSYDLDYYALYFLYTPRMEHPTKDKMSPFYDTILSNDKFHDELILHLPNGAKLIKFFSMFSTIGENRELSFQNTLNRIKNDKVKGEYLVQTQRIRTHEEYEVFIANYGKYIITLSQKARIEVISAKVANSEKGEKASDFTYPDTNGKLVSLSDFKGKVVYLDVWATWCGPCMKEVPHLNKLEKELHSNKGIVFMSVSIDEEKDKQQWLRMVKDREMGGVQLFASGRSKITNDYKITKIPRFMIFNRNGNIHTIDAPRPSDPKLKQLLIDLSK